MNTRKSPTLMNAILAMAVTMLVACGPKPTATPIPATDIIVSNIVENDVIVGQIEQTRLFNQCENASALKTSIQFSQSSSETTQKELVISAGVTGGAEIPAVAKIELEGAIEEHFSVEKNSYQSRQETLDIEVPGGSQKEYRIIWNEIRRKGTIQYLENGESKFANYSYRVGIEFASSAVKDIGCLVTVTPSPTLEIPTETPMPAPEATEPPPPTEQPIAEGCIFAKTWQADSTDAEALSGVSIGTDGCYSLGPLGISASDIGTLRLFKDETKYSVSSGMYMPVTDKSVIEFDLFVNYLYIVYGGHPAYISFAVAPASDPLTDKPAARFKLLVEKAEKRPIIFFLLADAGETTGTKVKNQHYEYGRRYRIRFVLSDVGMSVFINGFKMDEELSIPHGSKVFHIGYSLPVVSGMDVELSNITIDGVSK